MILIIQIVVGVIIGEALWSPIVFIGQLSLMYALKPVGFMEGVALGTGVYLIAAGAAVWLD